MKYLYCLLFMSSLCFLNNLSGQELSYGFKAGLNFSSILGDSEIGETDEMPETYDFSSGFHIGIIFNNKITDLFGIRAELLYSQKGSRYRFNGTSYQALHTITGERIFTTGTKDLSLNITNAYLDFPISAYGKVLPWLEIQGGFNVGALVSSSGSGEIRYDGVSPLGIEIDDFVLSLDHKYFADKGGFEELGNEPIIRNFDGTQVDIPKSIGAYYEYAQDEEVKLFNRLDFGLQAGVSIFLNQGLFLGLRANYGFADVTNNDYDRSLINLGDNNEFINRDDVDRNFSFQASIGFSF